jgi:hypothetical protein
VYFIVGLMALELPVEVILVFAIILGGNSAFDEERGVMFAVQVHMWVLGFCVPTISYNYVPGYHSLGSKVDH